MIAVQKLIQPRCGMMPTTQTMLRMVSNSPRRSAQRGDNCFNPRLTRSHSTKGMIAVMGNWELT